MCFKFDDLSLETSDIGSRHASRLTILLVLGHESIPSGVVVNVDKHPQFGTGLFDHSIEIGDLL